ncbi:MAG TPA: peptidoglycan editing factor PgeF [Desulfurella acetivorans]|uniref:Purine nucleoside phosphorylase n=1 Tax=Desulfurella acetivorans TaxID=33002 RepID=A0A7C6A6S7_DESAE|nr:peptidoglycan editing factor PgeF [Desulfurella acetivorans]
MIYEDERFRRFGARCVFFDRSGGMSPKPFDSLNVSVSVGDSIENVKRNLEIVKNNLNVDEVAMLNQVHSDKIVEYNGTLAEADGFFTNKKGIFLSIKFADCCPVIFMDVKNKIIASVHSGWRGAYLNISQKMLEKLYSFGAKAEDIIVTLGPHICQNCYEIKDDVASNFDAKFIKIKGNQKFLSLSEAIIDSLVHKGLDMKNIYDMQICTYENENFFSYRRDKLTGRNIGGVYLLDN